MKIIFILMHLGNIYLRNVNFIFAKVHVTGNPMKIKLAKHIGIGSLDEVEEVFLP